MAQSPELRWQQLAGLWWERLPDRIGSLVPGTRSTLEDGYFLTAWPRVAALAGPILGALGLLTAILVRASRVPMLLGVPNSPTAAGLYSQHLWFILLAVAAGMLSAHLGAWLALGYMLPDFLLHLTDPLLGLPRLYADLLLLTLCVVLGPRARQLGQVIGRLLPDATRSRVDPRWIVAACAFVGAFFWNNSFSLLARPAYAWTPAKFMPWPVVQPIKTGFWLIALLAAGAAYARLTLEAGRPDRQSEPAGPPPWLLRLMPAGTWQAAVIQGVGAAVLLGGMMTAWLDFILYAAVMTLFAAAQSGLVPFLRLPEQVESRLAAIPPVRRALIALAGGLVVTYLVLVITLRWFAVLRVELVIVSVFLFAFHLFMNVRPADQGKEVDAPCGSAGC